MTMSDLILDRANETCALRDRPPAPRTGRPTRLTDEQVRRGRYLYWTGRVTAAALAVEWGLTRRAAAKVCSFVTLRHV